MKVTIQRVWWKFRCSVCKAICEAEPSDVKSRPNVDHEGDVVGQIPVVECGNCGKQRDVPPSKITQKIEDIAAGKK